ncbi:hypothetical protein LZ578_12120 (plasmid) [Jeotgalibaca sp. MA1X17-3]|uniref:hypothetical protein n=1 Tax=Jeotgalibaca sp. MA1X17-3 TaxID=2908211 RepID=UPI001F41D89F|nr:hypothetical protein [Jeotgalibaca sp. MA1X17-3]UJF16805.1 hypothetical protein LZ578_12120 [Jeotgalibaca sp. MA1X17-3]
MMIYATKIKMCSKCPPPWTCHDIDSIYLEGEGKNKFYKKEEIYHFLRDDQDIIQVRLGSNRELQPVLGLPPLKYIRSEAYDTKQDFLLKFDQA